MKKKLKSSVASKFLRPEQIDSAIEELAALAKDQDVDIALAGGVAMQLYGSDRFTRDVDIVVGQELEGLKETEILMFGGFAAYTTEKIPVDVILRNDAYAPLYQVALEVPRRFRGVPLPVVGLEYLAAMKFAAHRGKDLDDLAFLVLHTPLNMKRTLQIVEEYLGHYAIQELNHFVEDVRATGGRR
jgi:hypothetical protein